MLEYNGESIRYMREKFKSFLADDTIFMVLMLSIVGITSFGLGRMSMHEDSIKQNKAIVIDELPRVPDVHQKVEGEQAIPVVASKSGTKYHLLNCPGAKQIKQENKIEFASIKEAEAAGYAPASNCPGL